jgi:hypothetical protein
MELGGPDRRSVLGLQKGWEVPAGAHIVDARMRTDQGLMELGGPGRRSCTGRADAYRIWAGDRVGLRVGIIL